MWDNAIFALTDPIVSTRLPLLPSLSLRSLLSGDSITIAWHARLSSRLIFGGRKKRRRGWSWEINYREPEGGNRCSPLVLWCKLVCWESARPPSPNNRGASCCPRTSCNRWCPEEGFSRIGSARARCPLKREEKKNDETLIGVRERDEVIFARGLHYPPQYPPRYPGSFNTTGQVWAATLSTGESR